MKTKSVILSFLLVAIAVIGANAQGFHVGIKGGANIYKVDGQSFSQEYKYGYNLGGFAEINFNKSWGIQPEILWNQSKTQTGTAFNQLYDGFVGQDVTLNYLSIPLLLNIRPVPLLTIQVGPQYGILIDKNANLFQNGKNAFKNGDFSMIGGAQLNLSAFKIGARYVVGLSNINDLDNKDKWKNQGFQLYVGLRII